MTKEPVKLMFPTGESIEVKPDDQVVVLNSEGRHDIMNYSVVAQFEK